MTRKALGLLLALTLLTACAAPAKYGGRRELPADGVVSSGEVSTLRAQNGVAVMAGSSQGVSYEWTLFGADIPEDAPLSLGVTVEGVSAGGLTVRFADTAALPFAPLLSLTLPVRWDAQSAYVGIARGNGVTALSPAPVTQAERGSVVHLSVTERDGALRVVPQTGPASPPRMPCRPRRLRRRWRPMRTRRRGTPLPRSRRPLRRRESRPSPPGRRAAKRSPAPSASSARASFPISPSSTNRNSRRSRRTG